MASIYNNNPDIISSMPFKQLNGARLVEYSNEKDDLSGLIFVAEKSEELIQEAIEQNKYKIIELLLNKVTDQDYLNKIANLLMANYKFAEVLAVSSVITDDEYKSAIAVKLIEKDKFDEAVTLASGIWDKYKAQILVKLIEKDQYDHLVKLSEKMDPDKYYFTDVKEKFIAQIKSKGPLFDTLADGKYPSVPFRQMHVPKLVHLPESKFQENNNQDIVGIAVMAAFVMKWLAKKLYTKPEKSKASTKKQIGPKPPKL